ncbi:hypothetical protein U4960_08385 [Altererythrobacter sp. H2]|nr:hypothetical protein [Altererythrobacter sp. H2]WRK94320.1 hypothetical protein U4960_08385 [Altererythrobacter sp. H2]
MSNDNADRKRQAAGFLKPGLGVEFVLCAPNIRADDQSPRAARDFT